MSETWKCVKLICGPSAHNFDLRINGDRFYPIDFAIDFGNEWNGGPQPIKVSMSFYVQDLDVEIKDGDVAMDPKIIPGLPDDVIQRIRDQAQAILDRRCIGKVEKA